MATAMHRIPRLCRNCTLGTLSLNLLLLAANLVYFLYCAQKLEQRTKICNKSAYSIFKNLTLVGPTSHCHVFMQQICPLLGELHETVSSKGHYTQHNVCKNVYCPWPTMLTMGVPKNSSAARGDVTQPQQ
jgi:hypothetical protein